MRRAHTEWRWFPAGAQNLLWLGLVLAASTVPAFAAEAEGQPSTALFLVEVLVLIVAGRLLGELMQRMGQPSVMGHLLAGVVLGPSVFGAIWPEAQQALFPSDTAQKGMVSAVGQVGVLMLLLLAGMETDIGLARRTGRASLAVSIAGICLPFACGFALGLYLPGFLLPNPDERLPAALLLGTALSISSVKIVAVVVREMNFMRRNIGQIILAAAVIDDTIGWIIIAITLSLVENNQFDWQTLVKSVIGTAVFLGVSFTIGRRLVFWLIRWTNDTFESELPVISLVLALTFGMALITDAIGVHDVLGAFVAGILVGQSPILTKQIDQQLRGIITALFMPIFFGLAGITADLTILANPEILMLTTGLVAIATLGKFSGAFAGGLFGGLKFPESLAIACGMNARGSTEVIVATIGLSMGVLSQDLFTMIVTMAVLTTLAMPPSLRWALARLPMRQEERQRIEREEFEAKGFMPNVERMLLAVDDSPNGKFIAHLTGLLAGRRGTPTTLLRVRPEVQGEQSKSEREAGTEASLQAGGDVARISEKAEQAAADAATREEMTGEAGEAAPKEKAAPRQKDSAETEKAATKPSAPAIPLTRAEATAETAESMIARESRKGYDLLMVGVDDTVGPDGALHEDVARIAAGFKGPIGVAIARGHHRDTPTRRLKILVPVSGNNVSRRAAEVAVMLARAQDVPVTFLYVAGAKRSDGRISNALHQHEHAALKELVTWAERYDTKARVAIRTDVGPEDAILREVKHEHFDLVVMGVNRRPGEALFFGNVAGAVIADAEASVLLLSS